MPADSRSRLVGGSLRSSRRVSRTRSNAPPRERTATAWTQGRPLFVLAALVALAALLRLPTLDAQSFWFDESVTAVDVVRPGLGETLRAVPSQELAPPLHPLLGWLWAQLFGEGEAALRSLSALAGILTVPVVHSAAARLGGARAGLVAATLAAVNPLLVWYGQEARVYALLMLLAALGFLFFVRALRRTPRALAAWSAFSCLALLSHYFAVLVVAPQLLWLLVRSGRPRAALAASAPPVAVGLALVPLALHQRGTGGADWIAAIPLTQRIADFAQKWVVGWPGAVDGLWLLPALLLAVALAVAAGRARPRERRGAGLALGVGAAAVLVPLALALAGLDYLYYRHLVAALPPLLVGSAVLLGAPGAGRLGLAAVAALALTSLAVNAAVLSSPDLQRDDWRAAARVLGPPEEGRALVLNPFFAREPLIYYGHDLVALPLDGAPVREIALVGSREAGMPFPRDPRVPGFALVERTAVQKLEVVRLRAPAPRPVSPADLTRALAVRPDALVLEPAR